MARQPEALNVKEQRIADTLRAAGRPLSAYGLIERLNDQGVISPPTVYRALRRLVREGLVHRPDSLNAFVCCAHGLHRGCAVFAICEACGQVTEFDERDVACRLSDWARSHSFQLSAVTLELRGRCRACATPTTTVGNIEDKW
jgi:Fur family zinc uptake transcriptional regulator